MFSASQPPARYSTHTFEATAADSGVVTFNTTARRCREEAVVLEEGGGQGGGGEGGGGYGTRV